MYIVYVDTTRTWDSPFSGQIRLTGGKYSNQGLLEIYQRFTVMENGGQPVMARQEPWLLLHK